MEMVAVVVQCATFTFPHSRSVKRQVLVSGRNIVFSTRFELCSLYVSFVKINTQTQHRPDTSRNVQTEKFGKISIEIGQDQFGLVELCWINVRRNSNYEFILNWLYRMLEMANGYQ